MPFSRATPLAVTLIALGLALAFPSPGLAQKAKSPSVTEGQITLDYEGLFDRDDRPAQTGKGRHQLGVGYGATSFWKTEVRATALDPAQGRPSVYEGTEWRNTLRFVNAREEGLEAAVYSALEIGGKGEPNVWAGGVLASQTWSRFRATANALLEKQNGRGADSGVNVEVYGQGLVNVDSLFAVGLESVWASEGTTESSQQTLRVGPFVKGSFPLGPQRQTFVYQVGYQTGLTAGTSDGRLIVKLSYVFPP